MNEYQANELTEKKEGEYVLPPIDERIGSVVAYTVALTYILRELMRETRIGVLGAYRLGFVDESIFTGLKTTGSELVNLTRGKADKIFKDESISHTKKFIKALKKILGIDVSLLAQHSDTDDLIRTYVQKNASLIKSMNDDMIKRIELEVYEAKLKNKSVTELSKNLQKHFVTMKRTRADLIAGDQLSKLNADMNSLRQQQAGQKEYSWDYQFGIPRKSSREYHKARHRKVFKFGQPSGDEPGFAVNCRCRHRAVFKVVK